MDLIMRTAVASDEPVFVQAQVAGWQHAYKEQLPASYLHGSLIEERREFWRECFKSTRPHQLLAVAELHGDVVGVTCAFSAIPITHGECCIDQLYVLPSYKRMGVGKTLIAAAAAWCEERASTCVVLSVIEGNTDAVKFYQALGGIPRVAEPWLPPCGGSLSVLEFQWPDIRVLSAGASAPALRANAP
jgi:GNAT superfamily N-acetyltransferase